MCDRIGILNKGTLVALDSTKNLIDRIQYKKVAFKLNSKVEISIKDFNSLNIISSNENELIVSYDKSKLSINEIISFLNKQDVKILDISTEDGDLEDVFVRLTKN